MKKSIQSYVLSRVPSSWLDVVYSRPDFLIIGGQKCGTTALYDYLVQHPQVLPAHRKEVHYFDFHYAKGELWYRLHLPSKNRMKAEQKRLGKRVITGEASPCYLLYPETPQRIRRFVPQAKLLVLLRNPVDRAFSHYQMNAAKKEVYDRKTKRNVLREPLSFEEALEREEERMKLAFDQIARGDEAGTLWLRTHSYKTRGLYAQQIKRWLDFFPRDQFLFVDSAQLHKNANTAFQDVLDFLDVQPFQLQEYEAKHVGSYSRRMESQTRQQLIEYFKPHNKELYELLGQNFDWDR